MGIIYWSSIYVLETLKLYLLIVKLMEYEHKNIIRTFIKGLMGVLIIVSFIEYNGLVDNAPYIVGVITISVISLSLKNLKNISVVFLCYLIICVIDMILGSICAVLLDYNVEGISKSYFLGLISNSLSVLIFIIIGFIKKLTRVDKLHINKRHIGIIFLGISGIALYIAPVQILGLMQKDRGMRFFTVLGINLSGIAFIIICTYLIILNRNNKYYQECLVINEKLLEQQKDYYAMLIEKDTDTKKFRHDITNHIYCMNILLEDKKYDELYSYMNDMQGAIEKLSTTIQTGNDIVNVIVADVLGHKVHNEIKLKWRGQLPDKLKITSMDLCIIFSNILKNSLEAVEKIVGNEEKKIEIKIKQFENNLLIQIKNSVNEKVNMIDNKLITSKLDKSNHGFGSLNVKEAVNKYGGNIKYISTENTFSVEIIINDIIIS